jgi:NDP-sugar pyrophosphorylase family protein
MAEPALIVMAAGVGSRYGGLKQIEPIGPNGEIILDYSVYDARQAGFGKVVFVINRKIESDFRARINQTIGRHCQIEFVFQELDNLPDGFQVPSGRIKPWGTAHAVLSCREVVEGSFSVINADDFYGRSAYRALARFLEDTHPKENGYSYCIVGYQLEKTLTEHGYVSRGICSVDKDGYLREVRERTHIEKTGETIRYTKSDGVWVDIPADSVASMNIWGFNEDIFVELEARFERFLIENQADKNSNEYFLPEVVNQLLAEGLASVKVLPTEERWFGVTYREDLEQVRMAMRKRIDQGEYPAELWG